MENTFLMPDFDEEDSDTSVTFMSPAEVAPSVTGATLQDNSIIEEPENSFMMPDFDDDEDDELSETTSYADTAIESAEEVVVKPDPLSATQDSLTITEVEDVPDSKERLKNTVELQEDISKRVEELYQAEFNRLDASVYSEENFANYTDAIQEELKEQNILLERFMEKDNITRDEALAIMQERNPDSILLQDPDVEKFNRAEKLAGGAERSKERLLNFLNSENAVTSGLTEGLLSSGLSIGEINAIVSVDEILNPITAVVNVPIHYRDVQENLADGDFKGAALSVVIGTLDAAAAIPGAKLLTGGINKGLKTIGSGGEYSRVQKAMLNESQVSDDILKANKTKASENKELRTQLIREFEVRNNVTISNEAADGNLIVDPTKVRATGKQKVTDYYYDDKYVGSDDVSLGLDDLSIGQDDLAIPMLNPTKLDALVGVVADLKELNPNALKTTKDERLVDRLFDLTLEKDLLASDELLGVLNKHGMSYEEYVLGVVGSGSEAGKLLNRLGQMKRIKPMSVKEAQAERARDASQKALGKFWKNTVLRGENIRRGLMVSSLATAARNLQSGFIRAPMESLGDVMDTALISYARVAQEGGKTRGVVEAVKNINPLVRDGTWSGSFRNMRYILGDQNTAEQFTNYILDRPELATQFERMFNSIGEIQTLTGRGQATTKVGKGLDAVVSKVEDGVSFLNKPNMWQDHMIRRATFYAELQRLTKANYGVDLQDTLNSGKIQELLNDAPTLRTKDSPSFISMVDDSVKKALDVTYASEPDFIPFKTMSRLITKSGLTVIVPFPRFMFKSMETMAQYTGGGAMLAVRKAVSKESRAGGMVARDRQDISRNLVGLAAIHAAYQYRKSEDAPADYTTMAYGDSQIDITAQYPLRQMNWLGDFARRAEEDTLSTWNGMSKQDIFETWLGTNARTGTGNVFLQEVGSMLAGSDDIVDEEQRRKTQGRLVGQYVNTFLTPLFQLSEAQRVQGVRTNQYKDTATDPELEGNFNKEFYRSLAGRGITAPSTEEALPARQTIDKGPMNRPNAALKLFAGLNVREKDNDVTDYLIELGYSDPSYELGSRSRVPSERRRANEFMSMSLPIVVDIAKTIAKTNSTTKKEEYAIARKYLNDGLAKLREEYSLSGTASPLAQAIDSLNRVPKVDRSYAMVQFKKLNDGRPPDVTNLSDLSILLELAEGVY